MKTIYVDQLTPGPGVFTEFFLVVESSIKTTKKNTSYVSGKLRDRTGEVNFKWWDSETVLIADTFVKVEFSVDEYKEETQLTVKRCRVLTDDDVSLEDFLPVSKRDRDEMIEQIQGWVYNIQDVEMKEMILNLLNENHDSFRNAPAAKSHHQPYLGGLSEHILNLLMLSLKVVEAYSIEEMEFTGDPKSVYHIYYDGKRCPLNRDLLFAASILHDMGKIHELDYRRSIKYSLRGSLLGHVGIGLQMLREYGDKNGVCYRPWFMELEHIIASHHGRMDWGALVEPMTKEAMVFHQLDMIDSRVSGFDTLNQTGVFYNGNMRVYVPVPAGEKPEDILNGIVLLGDVDLGDVVRNTKLVED